MTIYDQPTIGDRVMGWRREAEEEKQAIRLGLRESLIKSDSEQGRKQFVFKGRPAQNEIFRALQGKQRGVVVAHRRAGKTTALCWLLFTAAYQKDPSERVASQPPLYFFVAPTEKQAANVAGSTLYYLASAFDNVVYYSSKNEVLFKHNGARIKLIGASNPDSARGQGPDGIVFDEYAFMSGDIWGHILQPALRPDGFAYFSSTPNGREAFFDLYEKANANPKTWGSVFLPNSITEILTKEQEREIYDISPHAFQQEIECRFDAPVPGSFYGEIIEKARVEGRVGTLPYDPTLPVYTAWDLGISDDTAIWFFQIPKNGSQLNVIDFISGAKKSMVDWANELMLKGYTYAVHILPHDAAAHEQSSGTRRVDFLRSESKLEGSFVVQGRRSIQDGIDRARRILPVCFFDEKRTREGLIALELYKRQQDKSGRHFLDKPLKNEHSHAADAFRIGADFFQGKISKYGKASVDLEALRVKRDTARVNARQRPTRNNDDGDLISSLINPEV